MKTILQRGLKKSSSGRILLFLILILLNSCKNESGEAANSNNENLPYKFISEDYAKTVEASLDAWAAADFETWGQYLSDDFIYYSSYGSDSQNPFGISDDPKQDQINSWAKWFKDREISDVEFVDTRHMPLELDERHPIFGNSGNLVLTFTVMEMSIYGKPTRQGLSAISHFDDSGLIDRFYVIYDTNQQFQAMSY